MSQKVMLGVLIALIVGHILLAANYASITPYRQAGKLLSYGGAPAKDIGAPDERQHVNYVIHLLDGKGFPVFSPGDPNLYETYQSHQPPAYYLLAAAWTKVAAIPDLTKPDAGVRIRFLNALIGGGTVAGVFFLAFWGFRKPEVALAAASFAAFLPMMTALSGAVSNDPLLFLLCTWVLALAAKCLREGWSWKPVLLIGVLTGLAFLTKTTALALVPVLILAAFLPVTPYGEDESPRPGNSGRPSMAMIGAAAAIAVVLAAPWWARNMKLYSDPFAIKAFNSAFVGSAQKSDMITMIHASNPGGSSEVSYWTDYVGWWTARSFFGAFGYMDIWLNERGTSFTGVSKSGPAPNTLYRLLLAATALCSMGWVWSLTQAEWKSGRSIQILNGAFFFVVLALFLKFNMQYFQAQARYLMPAIGPIACGFAVGSAQLLTKYRKFAFPALAGLFLILNFYALSRLPDEFAKRVDTAATTSQPGTPRSAPALAGTL